MAEGCLGILSAVLLSLDSSGSALFESDTPALRNNSRIQDSAFPTADVVPASIVSSFYLEQVNLTHLLHSLLHRALL